MKDDFVCKSWLHLPESQPHAQEASPPWMKLLVLVLVLVLLVLLVLLLLLLLLLLVLLLRYPPLVRRRSLSSWMLNMFNESCRGPRCGVAKTRIVHTAAAIVSRWDIEKPARSVLSMMDRRPISPRTEVFMKFSF